MRPHSPLGADYLAGRDLTAGLRASRVDYRPATTLWHVDPDGTLYLARDGRSAIRSAYRLAPSVLVPVQDEIIACRCEAVSVGRIRRAARLGASGPNQLKAFTRCGTGPCHPRAGRRLADTLGRSIAEIGTYRSCAPYKRLPSARLPAASVEFVPKKADNEPPMTTLKSRHLP